MKILRIIFNPLLFLLTSCLCLYFLFYASFNSLEIENIVSSKDFVAFDVLYEGLDGEVKTFIDAETFRQIASKYTLDILNNRKIDSSHIINVINSKFEIILNNPLLDEETKQELNNKIKSEVETIVNSIQKISDSEEIKLVRSFYDVFSTKTLIIAIITFVINAIILFALNPKFKWLKYIDVIMGFMISFYFIIFLIINKILSMAASSEIMNIIIYCFNILFESSFYVCIYFMIAVFIILLIYKFLLLPKQNKKVQN